MSSEAVPDADRCVAYLMDALRDGVLQPGQRLGEESIARTLQMGRAPVRIAFERLVCAGLLRRMHRAGTFVRQLSLPEYRDLMEVRALLEGEAARLAARRLEPAALEELTRLGAELEAAEEKAEEDWAELQRLEVEFHTLIARLSGNEVLLETLQSQNLIRLCFVRRRQEGARGKAPVPHREVVGAIASGDPARAGETMRRHILAALEAAVQPFQGAPFS